MGGLITDICTECGLLTAHHALTRVLRGTFVRGRVPGCEDDIVDRCADPVYRENITMRTLKVSQWMSDSPDGIRWPRFRFSLKPFHLPGP